MRKQTRVLVTGAAGFIGSHTVEALLEAGCEVVAVDDLSSGRAQNLQPSARREDFVFDYADISSPGVLIKLCRKFQPDAIIHLAGLVSVIRAEKEPDLNYRLNIHATHLVAEAARKCGVPRVVFASSAATYGDASELPTQESSPKHPISMYGMAKRISEQLLSGYSNSYGLETVRLRFFNVYGPRQDPSSPYSGVMSVFARRFKEGKPVTVYGDGKQTRDFVSVYDVARALTASATRPGLRSETVNVCTQNPVSLLEVIEAFRSIYPNASEAEFLPARAGEILHSLGSAFHAESVLGFRARVSLEEGLRSLVTGEKPTPVRKRDLVPQML